MEANRIRYGEALNINDLESGQVRRYGGQIYEEDLDAEIGFFFGAGDIDDVGTVVPKPFPTGESMIMVFGDKDKPLNLTAGAGTIPCSAFVCQAMDVTQIELKTTVPDTNLHWFFVR